MNPETFLAQLDALNSKVENDDVASTVSPDQITLYQVGPTAEWSQTLLITVASFASTIGTINDLIESAQRVRRVSQRIRDWFEKSTIELNPERPPSNPVLSLYAIIGLCLSDLEQVHGSLESLDIDWHCRSTTPLTTVNHPGGYETYTVRINTGGATYVYVVCSTGEVIDLFTLTNSGILPLVRPRWFTERKPYSEDALHSDSFILTAE